MEKRFETGEIRKLPDYVGLLKERECHQARVKVLEKYVLFERSMNFCLVEAEKNLLHRDILEILGDFVKEDSQRRNIFEVRDRIAKSGHSILADEVFKQFIVNKDKKMNTLCIKGVSNSGKT